MKGFTRFCLLQGQYHDHYPHVVVWAKVAADLQLSPHNRARLALTYMAYYQDGSAWRYLLGGGKAGGVDPLSLPISYQRRNLFGGRIARHLADLEGRGDLAAWLGSAGDWAGVVGLLGEVYGNGRWASYTSAEMLAGMGLCSVPQGYAIAGSSGPSEGLGFLGLPATERAAASLHRSLLGEGVDGRPEVFESYLCNWSRVCKGDFYVGQNLDRQQGRLRKVETLLGVAFRQPWRARLAVLPRDGLGEVSGWAGVDKKRAKAYRDTGRVLAPSEGR